MLMLLLLLVVELRRELLLLLLELQLMLLLLLGSISRIVSVHEGQEGQRQRRRGGRRGPLVPAKTLDGCTRAVLLLQRSSPHSIQGRKMQARVGSMGSVGIVTGINAGFGAGTGRAAELPVLHGLGPSWFSGKTVHIVDKLMIERGMARVGCAVAQMGGHQTSLNLTHVGFRGRGGLRRDRVGSSTVGRVARVVTRNRVDIIIVVTTAQLEALIHWSQPLSTLDNLRQFALGSAGSSCRCSCRSAGKRPHLAVASIGNGIGHGIVHRIRRLVEQSVLAHNGSGSFSRENRQSLATGLFGLLGSLLRLLFGLFGIEGDRIRFVPGCWGDESGETVFSVGRTTGRWQGWRRSSSS